MAVVTRSKISSSLPSSQRGSSMMQLSSRCVSEVSPSSASWVTEAEGLVPWIWGGGGWGREWGGGRVRRVRRK